MILRLPRIPQLPAHALTSLIAAVSCSFLEPCVAEEGESVSISVRAIQASQPIEDGQEDAVSIPAPKLAGSLSDIAPKLSQLPFGEFTLLASKNEVHSLKKRETMSLPNGQTLTLRPMYLDHKRVGMWLSWRESDGSEILNTRVHFDTDDAVLTGTDCANNKGLILAIKAVPVTGAGK